MSGGREGRGGEDQEVAEDQEGKEEEEKGQETQLQSYRLLLCKEKEKIDPGRLPESRVNHRQSTGMALAHNTHTHAHTGTHSVPFRLPS